MLGYPASAQHDPPRVPRHHGRHTGRPEVPVPDLQPLDVPAGRWRARSPGGVVCEHGGARGPGPRAGERSVGTKSTGSGGEVR